VSPILNSKGPKAEVKWQKNAMNAFENKSVSQIFGEFFVCFFVADGELNITCMPKRPGLFSKSVPLMWLRSYLVCYL